MSEEKYVSVANITSTLILLLRADLQREALDRRECALSGVHILKRMRKALTKSEL